MNLDLLLTNFDRLIDSPEAIPKLRELILDLAVRGKLVPQDPAEGDARELIGSKIDKRTPRMAENRFEVDGVFPLPENWVWVLLPEVLTKLTDGTHHSPPNAKNGDYLYITAKNIKPDGVKLDDVTYIPELLHREIFARCNPYNGDILYIKDGATTGVVTINQLNEEFSLLSSVALLKPAKHVFNRYLLYALRSPFFYSQTRDSMKGAAITRVTLKVLGAAKLPLPPLAEQRRIVARVDELMAQCDRLEAQLRQRDAHQTQLASAAIARFTADPAPANLENLFHDSFDISPTDLRKVILTLAVQGKLVKQNPKDENALKLLERITNLPEMRVKKSKELTLPGEAPFQLPKGWVWTTLGAISTGSDSGWSPQCEGGPRKGDAYGVLKISAVSWGIFKPEENKALPTNLNIIRECEVHEGDFLLSRANTAELVARSVIVDAPVKNLLMSDKIVRYHFPDLIDKRYINFTNLSEYARMYFSTGASGTSDSMLNVSRELMNNLPIPLPPFSEQKHIVKRVSQLFLMLDDIDDKMKDLQGIKKKCLSI